MIHRKMSRCLLALACALASAGLHCSSERTEFEVPREAGAPGPFVAPSDAGDAASASDAGPRQECSGTNRLIYVLGMDPDAIARFDPTTLQFTHLGYLACPVSGAFSMAIDRYNTAWIVLTTGSLVQVDLDDLRCREVVMNNPFPDLSVFGMAFSKNEPDPGETLFLWNRGLYKVDPARLDVEWVGQTSLPRTAELTGTGEGQLFGFTPYNGMIAQLDKKTGVTLEAYRTSAVSKDGFAFAQWGGNFWLFTGRRVIRYSPATDTSEVVVQDGGMHVVGAGSSTCAPFKPVN